MTPIASLPDAPEREAGPLAGLAVVEIGRWLAAPLLGGLLADQGAEVIKIEPPDGVARHEGIRACSDRGKRSLRLDLKSAADRTLAQALVARADLVVDDFGPGALERLGLSVGAACAADPRLVWVSLPGFASTDPDLAGIAAWEGVIAARCGLFTDLHVVRQFLELPPTYTALPLASAYGAVQGAVVALAALTRVRGGGHGGSLEVPLAACLFNALSSAVLEVEDQPERYDVPRVPRILSRWAMPWLRRLLARRPRAERERLGRRLADRAFPAFMRSYGCGDGRLLYLFAIDHRRFAAAALETLGLTAAARNLGLAVHDPYDGPGRDDNLADTSNLSRRRQRRLVALISERLKTAPAEEWEERLAAAGVPCAVQRTTEEWCRLPALAEAGIRLGAAASQPGLQAWLDEPFARGFTARPAPAPDQDRADILAHLAQPAPPRPLVSAAIAPERAAASLQGLRVLDLSTMVAGPTCARTLAELGAEVLKIDAPRPLHGPRMTCWLGLDVNQGKRSALLDLKDAGGRAAFRALVRSADVLVHNFSRGAQAGLALRRADLAALNPRLVVCEVGACAGPLPGRWDDRRSYDPVLQAASGVMVRYGSADRPELHGIASCVDCLTGQSAAFGILLGLFQRAATGRGALARTSLAQSAQLAQIPFMVGGGGRTDSGFEPSGQLARGAGPLERIYDAADAPIFICAPTPPARAALRSTLDLPADWDDAAIQAALTTRFSQRTAAEWEQTFRGSPCGVTRVVRIAELRRTARDAGRAATFWVARHAAHPAGGTVVTVAAGAWLRPGTLGDGGLAPAPKPGADTRAILGEAGMAPAEAEALLRSGAAATRLSSAYLPA